jgi:hypothetical protein
MNRITTDELARRIKELKPGSELCFHEDSECYDIFGVTVIEKFETFFMLINSIGGGTPFMAEIGENYFPPEAEQDLLIYLSELEFADNIVVDEMKTKTFNFGQSWQVYGTNCVQVPIHFSIEQAIAYVKTNWADMGLAPTSSYVQDSDEPDFENCDFSE